MLESSKSSEWHGVAMLSSVALLPSSLSKSINIIVPTRACKHRMAHLEFQPKEDKWFVRVCCQSKDKDMFCIVLEGLETVLDISGENHLVAALRWFVHTINTVLLLALNF